LPTLDTKIIKKNLQLNGDKGKKKKPQVRQNSDPCLNEKTVHTLGGRTSKTIETDTSRENLRSGSL
jgi:hypothetical protein